jgi:phage-related protein
MAPDVEAEPEVTDWYLQLSADERDVVATHIDLLADLGHRIRMPHARQLGQGLLELRFNMSRRSWRITYWHRPDGVIVLLTMFHKQRNNEANEIARARRALQTCRARHQP